MDQRKKIFINASTVLISGGLILSQNIIHTFVNSKKFDIFISCPLGKPYQFFTSSGSTVKVVPQLILKRWLRWYLDFIWLPFQINRFKPDIVLSLCNLPARTKFRQCFLHDNPYLTAELLEILPLIPREKFIHKLRNKVTLSRMKYVDLLLSQNKFQETALCSKLKRRPVNMRILPPSIPLFRIEEGISPEASEVHTNKIRFLCLSRYYPHKNLEFLLEVANLIKSKNIPFCIFLTINAKQDIRAKKLLDEIGRRKLENVLINLGHIRHRDVPAVLKNADAVILPSLLESFSLAFIEAWYYKIPLFTSALESMQSSCGEAAFYFNPGSPPDALQCMISAFNDRKLLEKKIASGAQKISLLPDWEDYIDVVTEM